MDLVTVASLFTKCSEITDDSFFLHSCYFVFSIYQNLMKISLNNVKSLDTQRAGLKIFYVIVMMLWFPWCSFMCLSWFWWNVIHSNDKSDKVVRHRPGCNNHLLVLAADRKLSTEDCFVLFSHEGEWGGSKLLRRDCFNPAQIPLLWIIFVWKSQSIYADESVILQWERNQFNHFTMLLFFRFFWSIVLLVWT